MKGKEMKIKRILASLIALSVFSTTTFAFTPFGNMPAPETESSNTQSESIENGTEQNEQHNALQQFKPKDYQYRMFEQILDAYVKNHLYDFTKEDVFHKFFKNFLNDNPMYFQLFMEYLLGTMDPYSSYYDSSSDLLEPNKDSLGFGFTIADKNGGVYIESVVEGSNAHKAGFMAGDKFISVAGINVEGQSFDVVTTILARPQNFVEKKQEETNVADSTSITATEEVAPAAEQAQKKESSQPEIEIIVDRNGEKLTFNLSKGHVELSQISSFVDKNNEKPTAYILLSSFLGKDTEKQFANLVKKYADEGIKHLTIDVRDNGGGSLDFALAMAEVFLEKGELICYYDDRTLEKPQPVYSTTEKVSFDSITILINEHSASAAELFTSILQDKGLAKVVGTKSYGKSLGQTVYSLANGDFFTITTYQMLNEKFESYDGVGVIPDITIENVEMCYTLPSLMIFNHQNFVEIKEKQYSDVTKALEDRLELMGVLRNEYNDGIFDEITKTALFVLQKDHKMNATGYVDYETVSLITKIINSYKAFTYDEDTQYDVAMIIHHSFSQGKRLANEKERLRKEQAELIEQRDAELEKIRDVQLAEKQENKTQENG